MGENRHEHRVVYGPEKGWYAIQGSQKNAKTELIMVNFYTFLNGLKVGDRLVVPKSDLGLVQHHALFLGYWSGNYWIIENAVNAGVRLVTADAFFKDVSSVTRIERFVPKRGYSSDDLLRYALSKQGKSYNLLHYNCESFCNEVQHFVVKSKQADNGLAIGAIAGLALLFLGLTSNQRS